MFHIKSKVIATYLLVIISSLSIVSCSKSNDTVIDKVEQKTEEMSESINEAYEETENELCEMVNGKMECMKKEIEADVKEFINEEDEADQEESDQE